MTTPLPGIAPPIPGAPPGTLGQIASVAKNVATGGQAVGDWKVGGTFSGSTDSSHDPGLTVGQQNMNAANNAKLGAPVQPTPPAWWSGAYGHTD